MKATATANANIALTKYWGRRDRRLSLPFTDSISMTLDGLSTMTTVHFDSKYKKDIFILDKTEFKKGTEYEEVARYLDIIRKMSKIKLFAKVVSENNFPTAAGLASSASGFAALSLSGSSAAGLDLDAKELSILARTVSGSASRSIPGGFVEWHKGKKDDGSDSFSEQIAPPDYWDVRMVIAVTETSKKMTSSREGMDRSVKTSPFFAQWIKECEKDAKKARKAIKEKYFALLGTTSEANCIKMHTVMMTSAPSIFYWNPLTLEIINSVMAWRDEGLECYFTIDAGPQVKILCQEKDAKIIENKLKKFRSIKKIYACKVGGPAKLIQSHFF